MSQNEQVSTDSWTDDRLARREEAAYLTHYLEGRYRARMGEAGFVLAINADWGMGKSFMLERWSRDLRQAGHPVVLFNAWENDFTTEPLVAFIAELDNALSPYFSKLPTGIAIRDKWREQAKAVLVPSLKVAGYAIVKQAAGIGMAQLTDMFSADAADTKNSGERSGDSDEGNKFDAKDLKDKLEKAVEETLKSHNDTKQAIHTFKKRLGGLIEYLREDSFNQLPVFVFIDELDRCRPDYAIRLLESIKHLFGVPGLYFVIATNLTELAHSIRAVYGSGFAGDRYLKRFFDMEYSLPEPEGAKFAEELMTPLVELAKSGFVTGLERSEMADQLSQSLEPLSLIFLTNSVAFDLTLRDQQQVAKILEAALLSLGNHHRVHIHFLVFLASLYQKSPQVFHNVYQAGHLGEGTKFSSTFPPNGKGFMVRREDHSGGHNVIAPSQVAHVYLDYMKDGTNNTTYQHAYEFPGGIYRNLLNARHASNFLTSYFEVIRRAGRFAK